MTREGAPASLYVPGEASANSYNFNVFGQTNSFPFSLAVQGGNPNLQSEEADTYTIGTVIRSPFNAAALQRLSLSVDYYNIDIEGAIAIPTTSRSISNAWTLSTTASSVARPARTRVRSWRPTIPTASSFSVSICRRSSSSSAPICKFSAQYVNLGGIRTKGIDRAARLVQPDRRSGARIGAGRVEREQSSTAV